MILTERGVRQRVILTSTQIAALFGLDEFMRAHGFILCCPSCAAEGMPKLETENDPNHREWKLDCQCRERRIYRSDVKGKMDADGTLIAHADEILKPVRLAVRCGQKKCLTHPLEIEHTPTDTIIRCRCAKTTLHAPRQTTH